MANGKPYEHAGWEGDEQEPVTCRQCSYEFQPFEETCRRCGWRPGDPVDEKIAAGPTAEELRAEQRVAEREWQRCMWAAAITVCVAAPVGYLIGQFTTDGAIGGAIIAAFIGGIAAGIIARPSEPLLGAVIGAICAIVYLVAAFLAMMSISHDRYSRRPTPSWGTLMLVGIIGGTAVSIGIAWYMSRREQVF